MKLLQPTNYRHELKYLCSNQSVTVLEARLQTILQTDNHSIDGRKYTVISIYFDDYQIHAYLQTIWEYPIVISIG